MALPEMVWDGLPDGDQWISIVSVRDEAGNVVLRTTLSLLVDPDPPKCQFEQSD